MTDLTNIKIWIGEDTALGQKVLDALVQLGCRTVACGENPRWRKEFSCIYVGDRGAIVRSNIKSHRFTSVTKRDVPGVDILEMVGIYTISMDSVMAGATLPSSEQQTERDAEDQAEHDRLLAQACAERDAAVTELESLQNKYASVDFSKMYKL